VFLALDLLLEDGVGLDEERMPIARRKRTRKRMGRM